MGGSRALGTLKAMQPVNIAFLGDADSGKSCFITSFITDDFPAEGMVHPVVDPVELTINHMESIAVKLGESAAVLTRVPLLFNDADGAKTGASAADVAAHLAATKPDIVLLCCDMSKPESLARAASYWLPAIAESGVKPPHWPYLPVVLCGTKMELFDANQRDAWAGALRSIYAALHPDDADGAEDAIANPETSTNDLRLMCAEQLIAYRPEVQTYAVCSAAHPAPADDDDDAPAAAEAAGSPTNELGAILSTAAELVAFPTWPLYDTLTGELTPAAEQAARRIFQALDRDYDGLLSADEMGLFQTHVYGLQSGEEAILQRFEELGGLDRSYVDDGGHALTPSGFSAFLRREIEGNSSAEPVWTVLMRFGYRLGEVPASYAAPAAAAAAAAGDGGLAPILPPGSYGLHLKAVDVRDPATGKPVAVDARCRHVLSRPAGVFDRLAYPGTADALRSAANTGLGFIAGLFRRYQDPGRPGEVMTREGLDAVFAVTPSRCHPFGPAFPFVVEHGDGGLIGWKAWLHLWTMLAATQPARALSALYELGYASLRSGGVARLDFNPLPALTVCPTRDAAARRRAVSSAGAASVYADDVCGEVGRVAVLGSSGAGKTVAILHALNRQMLREYSTKVAAERAAAAAAAGAEAPADGGAQTPTARGLHTRPTTAPTHYVLEAPPPPKSAASATGDDTAVSLDLPPEPKTLVVTEWPAGCVSDALDYDEAAGTGGVYDADVVVFVVDPARASSVRFFAKWAQFVPPMVPTVVLLSRRRAGGGAGGAEEAKKAANSEGELLVRALCSDAPRSVDLASAAAGASSRMVEDEAGGGEDGSALAPPPEGLNLPVYGFDPRSPTQSQAVRYASLRVHAPGSDNPRNALVNAERDRARRARLLYTTAGVVVTALAVAGAYRYHGGFRGRVNGAVGRVCRVLHVGRK